MIHLHRASLLLFSGLLTAIPASGLASVRDAEGDPPNFLIIIADDFGVDMVESYQDQPPPPLPAQPALDELAEDGVRFEVAWSSPRCSPTRATILTGQYGFRNRVGYPYSHGTASGAADTDFPLDTSVDHLLPKLMKTVGYTTALFGKWHLADDGVGGNGGVESPRLAGFDYFAGTLENPATGAGHSYQFYLWAESDPDLMTTTVVEAECDEVLPEPWWQPDCTYLPRRITDRAIAFAQSTQDCPWLTVVSFNLPHTPHECPDDTLNYPLSNPCDDMTSTKREVFEAMVEAMDHEIERLLADPAVTDNTLIFFVGDNGTDGAVVEPSSLASHAKGTVFERGVHVPLIVAGEGVAALSEGESTAAPTHTTDIFATITDIAGVDFSPHAGVTFDGVSLKPYLDDHAATPVRSATFSEHFFPNGSIGVEPVGWSPTTWDQCGTPLASFPEEAGTPTPGFELDVKSQVGDFTYGDPLKIKVTSPTTLGSGFWLGVYAFGGTVPYTILSTLHFEADPFQTSTTVQFDVDRAQSAQIFLNQSDVPGVDYHDASGNSGTMRFIAVITDGSNVFLSNVLSQDAYWPRVTAARNDRYKLIRYDRGGGEYLFDLVQDEDEQVNLLAPISQHPPVCSMNPAHQAAYDELADYVETLITTP